MLLGPRAPSYKSLCWYGPQLPGKPRPEHSKGLEIPLEIPFVQGQRTDLFWDKVKSSATWPLSLESGFVSRTVSAWHFVEVDKESNSKAIVPDPSSEWSHCAHISWGKKLLRSEIPVLAALVDSVRHCVP